MPQAHLNTHGEEDSEDNSEDEAHEIPNVIVEPALSQANRSQSSMSSRRYRTPVAGSLAMSPPPIHHVPTTQPLPVFETPSAFAGLSAASPHSSGYPNSSSYIGHFPESSQVELTPLNRLTPHPIYRGQTQLISNHQYGPVRPVSRPTIERAVENVQAHLAALTERLESLETVANLSRSHVSTSPRAAGSPTWGYNRGNPNDGPGKPRWDLDDLGMWSLILKPASRGVDSLREFATFFARNENRSPTTMIVRRLCLDISFLLCAIAVTRALWQKSGVRRREVRAALIVLWRAILGTKAPRTMVDRGI